jgi:hypothetical protein
VKPLAVSHWRPQAPAVQVATCPVEAGHTTLSVGHTPHAVGSDEGTPHVGGDVSVQVVQLPHPKVGTGALKRL